MGRARKKAPTYYEATIPLDEVDREHIDAVVEKLREAGYPELQVVVKWEVGPDAPLQDLYDLRQELEGIEADLDGYSAVGFKIPKPTEVTQ